MPMRLLGTECPFLSLLEESHAVKPDTVPQLPFQNVSVEEMESVSGEVKLKREEAQEIVPGQGGFAALLTLSG